MVYEFGFGSRSGGGESEIVINVTPLLEGVAGRVLLHSASHTITEVEGLFWDFTDGNLGIGTETPTYKLDISTLDWNAGGINNLLRINHPDFGNAVGDEMKFNFSEFLSLSANVIAGGRVPLKIVNDGTSNLLVRSNNALQILRNTNITAGALHDVFSVTYETFGNAVNDEVGFVLGADAQGNTPFARMTAIVESLGKVGLKWYVYGASLAEKMYLTGDGNLGLGITPTAKFHVHTLNTDTTEVFKITNPSTTVFKVLANGTSVFNGGLEIVNGNGYEVSFTGANTTNIVQLANAMGMNISCNSGTISLGSALNQLHLQITGGNTKVLGTFEAVGVYKADGTSGVASFTGMPTSITVKNGIVTAIS